MNKNVQEAIENQAISVKLNGYHVPIDEVKLLVEKCPQLTCVDVVCGIDQWFDILVNLPNLKTLRISQHYFKEAGLKSLGKFTFLKELVINFSEGITYTFFEYLLQFHQLESLSLLDSDYIRDPEIEAIGKLQNLKSLVLQRTDHTYESIKHLSNLTNLHSLSFIYAYVEEDMQFIKPLVNLEELALVGYEMNINVLGIQNISKLEKLKTLKFSTALKSGVDATWFDYLGNLQNLETLCLRHCWCLSNENIFNLPKLKKLKKLTLESFFNLSTNGIKYLSQCTNLVNLSLKDCSRIIDQDLEFISLLKFLNCLDLSETNITDACIPYIHTMKSLYKINLDGCNCLTPQGLKSLKEIKGLNVVQELGCLFEP